MSGLKCGCGLIGQYPPAPTAVATQWSHQQGLMVAYTEPLEDAALDPGCALDQYRSTREAMVPLTAPEFVVSIAGYLAKQ